MKLNLTLLYKKLTTERKSLETVRKQLKNEFTGIDEVIDQVMDLTATWYLLPELQMRPLIINLWGLTGTGKTSLVKRLAELIRLDKQCFIFDMKDDGKTLGLEDVAQVVKSTGDKRTILVLDEFQHLGEPRRHPNGLWDLLDSGHLHNNNYSKSYFRIYDRKCQLEEALRYGVKVEYGQVYDGQRAFHKIVFDKFDSDYDEMVPWFFPESDYDEICDLEPERFPFESRVHDLMAGFDGKETIAFLKELLTRNQKPKVLDCTHSLIFVLGNLDEAYTMTKDFNPDISADEFHRLSQKITISHIKRALLATGFRSEQISRLGNNHIIYPAFSSYSYYRIIDSGLRRVAADFLKQCGLKLRFDHSILRLIFREGVYPTQGARPVLSTIHQIVSSKLGGIVAEVVFNKLNCDSVLMIEDAGKIQMLFKNGKQIIHRTRVRQKLSLEPLRRNRQDDFQAISAVHESGHAVISMILLRTVPVTICSLTAESEVGGFVITRPAWEYTSREQVICQLAMMLGGFAAEKMVFGLQQMTTGSESDLSRATAYASHMLKNCGMGSSHLTFQTNILTLSDGLQDFDHVSDTEIKELLNQAMKLTEATLKAYEPLLVNIAAYLADHSSMDQATAGRYLNKFTSGNESSRIIVNGRSLYYREALLNRLNTLETTGISEEVRAQLTPMLSFNMDAGQK
ncbi:MAG: hypothetical protein IPH20_13475 [Bacteroidales bacterium]|nr:hypothetical protein [Bacteroidales bacterium]